MAPVRAFHFPKNTYFIVNFTDVIAELTFSLSLIAADSS